MSSEGTPSPAVLDASNLQLSIVAARWHTEISDALLANTLRTAQECGASDIVHVRVAGAVELPVVVQTLARRSDAVIALGTVIRGSTPHFEHVCHSVTSGLTRVSLDEGVPIAHGVLTCDTLAQARARAGLPGSAEDKGRDATLAVIESALILRELRGEQ